MFGMGRHWGLVRSPRAWLAVMTIVSLAGVGLATLVAGPANLPALKSISRLGLHERAGGIMNLTLMLLGSSLLAFGLAVRSRFDRLRARPHVSRRIEWLLLAGFVVAAIGVSLTGLFSVQTPASTIVHNIGGFATPVALTVTLVGARFAIGGLGAAYERWTAVIVPAIVSLFLVSWVTRLIPYPVMEMTCFALIGLWLWLFESGLRRASQTAQSLASARSRRSGANQMPASDDLRIRGSVTAESP